MNTAASSAATRDHSDISAARLAANRANAQLSTGPVSDTGKATVSLNAVKTGLTGRTVLLPTDDAAAYQSLLERYQDQFQPVGPEECALVQSIVDIRWRLDRIPALEIALLNISRRQFPELDPDPATAEMQSRISNEKHFRNLQIQEARLSRRREKEMSELQRLQQARKTEEAAALERAAEACLLARHKNQPFNPAELGFEFSTDALTAYMARLTAPQTEQLLKKALAGEPQTMRAAA